MFTRMVHSILLPIVLACCAAPVAAADDTLVAYSGRSDQLLRPVVERFTEKTGVRVVLHAGSATELLNKLRLEGDRTEADVYFSNDAGTLQLGEDHDLFRPLPRELVESIPARYRGARDTWTGLSARARVLVVNTASDAGWVRSVFELADPRLAGRIAVTHASNESFVAGLSVYQAAAGDRRARAWLDGLRENAAGHVYPRHGAVVTDVAAGRRDVGLVNHYYVMRHLAGHPDAPIRMVIPDQEEGGMGVAWNVSGVAISKHTQRRALAESLVAFLVSPEGQRLFADANYEYPTRTGVDADPSLPSVDAMRVADVPLAELAARRAAALDLIDRAGLH